MTRQDVSDRRENLGKLAGVIAYGQLKEEASSSTHKARLHLFFSPYSSLRRWICHPVDAMSHTPGSHFTSSPLHVTRVRTPHSVLLLEVHLPCQIAKASLVPGAPCAWPSPHWKQRSGTRGETPKSALCTLPAQRAAALLLPGGKSETQESR